MRHEKQDEQLVYTYKDLEELPEDPRLRYEILDGDLVLSPAPLAIHYFVLRALFRILDGWVQTKKLGEVFFPPFDVFCEETNVLEPDLLFLSKKRLSLLKENFIKGGPDLVVEV